MAGQGVTNYSVDKPSYAFTTATTEFDDALIKRGTVTHEQAMAVKGASAGESQRLAALAISEASSRHQQACNNTYEFNAKHPTTNNKDEDSDDSNEDFDDDDDDDFMQNYRQQRLAEMKQERTTGGDDGASKAHTATKPRFGDVIPIQRPEWTHHVNKASHHAWVVVVLTSSNVESTGSTEAAAANLAHNCPSIKFVTIPSTSAIANFPDANLPAIFVYRGGSMVHELLGGSSSSLKRVTTPRELLRALETAGVQFESQEVRKVQESSHKSEEGRRELLRRRMMLMHDEEGDDDEVF